MWAAGAPPAAGQPGAPSACQATHEAEEEQNVEVEDLVGSLYVHVLHVHSPNKGSPIEPVFAKTHLLHPPPGLG